MSWSLMGFKELIFFIFQKKHYFLINLLKIITEIYLMHLNFLRQN